MELIAEFSATIMKRYQLTLPLGTRNLLAAKGKRVQVGDAIIVHILKVDGKGEGLEPKKGSEDRGEKPKKDTGGDPA